MLAIFDTVNKSYWIFSILSLSIVFSFLDITYLSFDLLRLISDTLAGPGAISFDFTLFSILLFFSITFTFSANYLCLAAYSFKISLNASKLCMNLSIKHN